MITIIMEYGQTYEFEGDELTSAISEAIIYLQEKQQEELEL